MQVNGQEVNEILLAGAGDLAKFEFWCVVHPEGVLHLTTSKDLSMPVQTFCEAMDCDWDEAVENGFSLDRIVIEGRDLEDVLGRLPPEKLFGALLPLARPN